MYVCVQGRVVYVMRVCLRSPPVRALRAYLVRGSVCVCARDVLYDWHEEDVFML